MKKFIDIRKIEYAINELCKLPASEDNENDYNSLQFLRIKCNEIHNEFGELEIEMAWLTGMQDFVIEWLRPSSCSREGVIDYRTHKENGLDICSEVCPYGVTYNERFLVFFYKKIPVYVGSIKCEQCEHFKCFPVNDENKIICKRRIDEQG